jgi:hypothetical protein
MGRRRRLHGRARCHPPQGISRAPANPVTGLTQRDLLLRGTIFRGVTGADQPITSRWSEDVERLQHTLHRRDQHQGRQQPVQHASEPRHALTSGRNGVFFNKKVRPRSHLECDNHAASAIDGEFPAGNVKTREGRAGLKVDGGVAKRRDNGPKVDGGKGLAELDVARAAIGESIIRAATVVVAAGG